MAASLKIGMNSQKGDVWVVSARREARIFATQIEGAESHQALIRVAISPNLGLTVLDSLGDIVVQQPTDESIGKGPAPELPEIFAVDVGGSRAEQDRRAFGHARSEFNTRPGANDRSSQPLLSFR